MELFSLKVLLAVAAEQNFTRAGEKLLRTQPAISLSIQRLEDEVGEKLIERSGKEIMLTDAGKIVVEYARRIENLIRDMGNDLTEMRDNSAGRLVVGANESTTLYLLQPIVRYRELYPKVKVQVRRSLSSKIPSQLIDGDLELGVISFAPGDERLISQVIYTDHLAFVVSPDHHLAGRAEVSINELSAETFIAHNVLSPYRELVIRAFQAASVPLRMEVEMPTVETIRNLVQRNEGVAFLPKMCVATEIEQGRLCEVMVPELVVERKIYLVYPARRKLSHAAQAFLGVLAGENG